MNARVPLQLPSHTFFALTAFLQESGSLADAEEVAAAAIEEWIAQQRTRADAGRTVHARGYQWKQLFLPEGTRLRMLHDSKYHYAQVEGDNIVYGGRPVSPARMANEVAGSTRNAWRDIWLQLPGEHGWRPASARRRQASLVEQASAAGTGTGMGVSTGTGMAAGLRAGTCMSGVAAGAPAMAFGGPTGTAEALLRRLAALLQRTIESRQPLYRRRTDVLADD